MRPSRVVVDLAALRDNYAYAKARHGSKVVAVLKADAYGHGAIRCAQALEPVVDALAVAFVEEAVSLRSAGVRAPILVLEGAFDESDFEWAIAHDCWLVVHQASQIEWLEKAKAHHRIHVWLKVNSGMHRLGFDVNEVESAWHRLKSCACVDDITLMTHLSSADELANSATSWQVAKFQRANQALSGAVSIANSSGILDWEASHQDWGRAGIMLYGVNSSDSSHHALKPVMTLESSVFAVRNIQAGDAVGYGAGFIATQPTRVGLVAIGYADGYPRTVPTGTPVSVGGHITQIIGRVSMDMLTIDLSSLPDVGIGSRVELWGAQVSVKDVASSAGTIAYELLCGVKRVPMVYQ